MISANLHGTCGKQRYYPYATFSHMTPTYKHHELSLAFT